MDQGQTRGNAPATTSSNVAGDEQQNHTIEMGEIPQLGTSYVPRNLPKRTKRVRSDKEKRADQEVQQKNRYGGAIVAATEGSKKREATTNRDKARGEKNMRHKTKNNKRALGGVENCYG